ncbi:serine protease filzig [Trichonephila clavipes]|nr:serine protease filzig [Trichonephila clavipes]
MKGQMNGLDIPVIMSRMRADTYNKKHTLFLEIKNADLDLFVRYLISYGYRYRRKKYLATLKARLGEYDTSASSDSRQDFGIETLITHPQYQEPYRQSNDIALLRLNKDAVFTEHVWPVCLPIRNTDVTGMNATVAGWGQTSFIGGRKNILQKVNVPVLTNGACLEMYFEAGHTYPLEENQMCAGYREGGKDSCQHEAYKRELKPTVSLKSKLIRTTGLVVSDAACGAVGARFESWDVKVQATVRKGKRSPAESFFVDEMKKWIERLNKCVAVSGDFFEK